MLGPRIQNALSALSLRSASIEPSLGGTSGGKRNSVTRASLVAAALGVVAKREPVGALLLEVVYTGKPRQAERLALELFAVTSGTKLVETEPMLAKAIVKLALGELCYLAGSRRCSCKGRIPSCEFCGGKGVRPNHSLSERARVSMLNGAVTRHRWRNGLGEAYERLLSALIERTDAAAVKLVKQLR